MGGGAGALGVTPKPAGRLPEPDCQPPFSHCATIERRSDDPPDSPPRRGPESPMNHAPCRPLSHGETQTRTGDTTIFSRVLYQLSYLAGPARCYLFGAGPGRARVGQRREPRLDFGPLWLEPGRQHDPPSELGERRHDGEAGPVVGDLVEDAAGLAEVDRVEEVAVDDRRRADAGLARDARARAGARRPSSPTRRGGPARPQARGAPGRRFVERDRRRRAAGRAARACCR